MNELKDIVRFCSTELPVVSIISINIVKESKLVVDRYYTNVKGWRVMMDYTEIETEKNKKFKAYSKKSFFTRY